MKPGPVPKPPHPGESVAPSVLAAIRALGASRPGWRWWAEPDSGGLVEVSWQAPGGPVGAVRVDSTAGAAAIRAAIAHAARAYEAVYVGPEGEAA